MLLAVLILLPQSPFGTAWGQIIIPANPARATPACNFNVIAGQGCPAGPFFSIPSDPYRQAEALMNEGKNAEALADYAAETDRKVVQPYIDDVHQFLYGPG